MIAQPFPVVHFAAGIYHFTKAIALALGPKASVNPQSIGVPTLPEALALVIHEIAGIYASIRVVHDAESMTQVRGGVSFPPIRGVFVVDGDDVGTGRGSRKPAWP